MFKKWWNKKLDAAEKAKREKVLRQMSGIATAVGPLRGSANVSPVYDDIDLDDFDFDEAAKYVEFASKNVYMVNSWEKHMNQEFTIYDVLVAQYFESREFKLTLSPKNIKKISKILQEAGVTIACQKSPYEVVQ